MDDSKPKDSNSSLKQQNNQTTDLFNDALDEFPFYDQNNQNSSLKDPNSSLKNQNANFPSRLRRRSLSHRFRDETTYGDQSNTNSSLTFDLNSNDINKDDLVTENESSLSLGDSGEFDSKRHVGFERKKGFSEKNDNSSSLTINSNMKDDLVTKNKSGSFDTKSDVGFERKKEKSEGGNDKNTTFNFNSLVKEIKEDFDSKSSVGLEEEKGFSEKIENSVDGNENNSTLSANCVNQEIGDDDTDSEDRKKRSFEKREDLVNKNGNSKGKGDNSDLHGGEISSNSAVDSASTKSRGSNVEGFDYNASEKRKKRFAKKLEVLKAKKENSDIQSEDRVNVVADREHGDELVVNESSSGFLLGFASLVIKAIGWQLSLLVTFVIFPIKFLYKAYMFVSDPFQIKRRIRSTLFKVFRVVCAKFVTYAGESLKDHHSMWQLALRFGWGFLWAAYVCTVLVTLLISGFLLSGVVMRKLVEEPIQMKETLTFDYTKNSPVAFVPIISCPVEPYDFPFAERSDVGDIKSSRVIPRNHKLQATVSLVLPESDYNRNLGVFQVRLDLLSANGRTLASLRHPSMLHFSSQSIRMLLTFFKVAPLVTGYSSESQTLNINLRGLTEGDIPTACIRVIIEQRAEFRPGAGVPEIYDASLTLESELPLLKKLMWLWKKTLFIWLGLSMFTMQLLLALVCCRPLIWPKGRVAEGPVGNIAPQNDHPAQR